MARKNPNPKLTEKEAALRRDIDNAKRRYRRQAARYEKEANALGGRAAELREQAAQRLRERAESLNGVNVRSKAVPSEVTEAINASYDQLVKNNRSDFERGENLGKTLLSGSNMGHRFFSLTESLWTGVPYDMRFDAIREAMLANPDISEKYGGQLNVKDMIDIVEETTGITLDTAEDSIGGSDDVVMMRGVQRIIQAYG